MGLQSPVIFEKSEIPNTYKARSIKNIMLGIETTFRMTAVIIFFILLIIFLDGDLSLMLLANTVFFMVHP